MLPSHLDDYDDDVRARPSFWCLPPGAFREAQLADALCSRIFQKVKIRENKGQKLIFEFDHSDCLAF